MHIHRYRCICIFHVQFIIMIIFTIPLHITTKENQPTITHHNQPTNQPSPIKHHSNTANHNQPSSPTTHHQPPTANHNQPTNHHPSITIQTPPTTINQLSSTNHRKPTANQWCSHHKYNNQQSNHAGAILQIFYAFKRILSNHTSYICMTVFCRIG